MTKNQYIQQLTLADRSIHGRDVPGKASAGVIDGLCDVIAEKDTVIADQMAVIASKDDALKKLNHELMWLKRKLFGHSSEKLHAEDPSQLSLDFGEEQVLPLSDEQLKEEALRVEDTKAAVHREAESRRARKMAAQSRKGQTYRIGPEVPRQEPAVFYPEGYDPETMVVIGWNTHEYLEIEGPKVSVRVEREAHRCPHADIRGQGVAELPAGLHRGEQDDGHHHHRQVLPPPSRVPPGEALRVHGAEALHDEHQPLAA